LTVDLLNAPWITIPFRREDTASNAVGYAMHTSRSHDAVIGVYDPAGNELETQRAHFKEW